MVYLLIITKETVLATVVCKGKCQIVRVGLAHNWVGPAVEALTDVLCRNIVRVHKRKELGDDLSGRVNAVIAEFFNGRRPHARNFIHTKIQQRTIHKLNDSVGAKRTF